MADKHIPSGMGLGQEPNKEPDKKEEKRNIKKFINKKTITIASMSVLALGGIVLSTNVDAQNAVRETANEVSVKVMKTRHSSDFENKKILQENEAIQSESKAAMDGITAQWTDNTVEEVRAEIERQREAGLDAYVVQWGDTLSVLADVLSTSVDELVARNNISDRHLILAGDILDGVLYQTTNADQLSEDQMIGASTDMSHVQETNALDELDNETNDSDDVVDDNVSENPDESVSNDDEDVDNSDKGNFRPVEPGSSDETDDDVDNQILPVDPSIEDNAGRLDEEFGVSPVEDEDIVKDEEIIQVGEDPNTEPIEVPEEDIPVTVTEVSVETEREDVEIPFEIETIEDDELEEGAEFIDVVGTPGLARIDTAITTMSDGTTRKADPVRTVVLEPVNQVVRVGTKPTDKVEVRTEEYVRFEMIDPEIEYIEVDDLNPGEERIIEAGEQGIRYELVKEYYNEHGRFDYEEVVDDNFSGDYDGESYEPREPVKQVIEIGKELDYDRVEEEHREVQIELAPVYVDVDAGEPLIDRNDEPILDSDGNPIILESGEEYVELEGDNAIIRRLFKHYYKEGQEQPIFTEEITFEDVFVTYGVNPLIHRVR